MRKMGNFKDFLRSELKKPGMAAAYLEAAMESYEADQDIEMLLNALRNVAEVQEKQDFHTLQHDFRFQRTIPMSEHSNPPHVNH